MKYYINSNMGRRKKVGKVILYVLAYVLVFAVSFFVSFKLVSGTQLGAKEIEALQGEVTSLNSKLAEKEEKIKSLQMQITNIEKSLSDMKAEAEAKEQAQQEQAIDE